jgi:hypothetical protein
MLPTEANDMPPTEANGTATTRRNLRDDGARALRGAFSSNDNWRNLSEAERDEWRGYFDRMLKRLHRLGYAIDHERWSIQLDASPSGKRSSDDQAP